MLNGARVRVAIPLLLIALGLAGCSADVKLQNESGALARAERTSRDLGSVRLRTTLRSRVDGITTRARGHGAIDFRGGRVSVTMAGTSGDREFEYETISEEHAHYSKTPGTSWTFMRAGGLTRQRAMTGARDPAAQLSILALVKNVGLIGVEKVDGVKTTRYGGEVEIAGYEIEPVDFWVNDQWRLRRLRTVTISTEGRQIATTEFYDYGAKISPIVAPLG